MKRTKVPRCKVCGTCVTFYLNHVGPACGPGATQCSGTFHHPSARCVRAGVDLTHAQVRWSEP